ncbi:MAG: carbohydrate ABC transporter permease [Pseudomonadota bacterium]|nr:carbohydrate ABC transporter permease [Pseudomonadota bacterium]
MNKRKARRRPLTPTKIVVRTIQYASLVIFSLIIIAPLWSVFAGSLKTPLEYLASEHITAPQNWLNFENYKAVIFPTYGLSIEQAFLNTALVMICAISLMVFFGTCVAYILDRFRFPGRLVILGAYAALVAVPSILTPVSTFQVLSFLGLANSRWALVVLYSGADIVSILIFMQFVHSISTEIDDSARLEGANYFQIFFRIIFPTLAPAIATVVILRSVYIYNDFVLPFLYASKPTENTVSMMLFNFASITSTVSQAIIMAAVILVILPTLIAFFFLQRFIYAGILQGSIKG